MARIQIMNRSAKILVRKYLIVPQHAFCVLGMQNAKFSKIGPLGP